MAAGLNSSPNKGMQGKARVAMVGLVITIAQCKGGAGKTTLPLSSLSRGRVVARGLQHLISIRKAVSQLGSICAGRGLGQRRSVLILPHCLAGARRTASGGSRSAIAARSVGDGGNAQNGARRAAALTCCPEPSAAVFAAHRRHCR